MAPNRPGLNKVKFACSVTWPMNGGEGGITLFCNRPHCFSRVNHSILTLTSPQSTNGLMSINNRSARAFYILVHFFAVLCKTTT